MKFAVVIIMLFAHCASWAQVDITPTTEANQTLTFEDDLNFQNMELVLERQLEAYNQMNLNGRVRYGRTIYPKARLKESVVAFRELVREARMCLVAGKEHQNCMDHFSAEVNRQFDVYVPVPGRNEPGYGSQKTTLYTAYYSPDLVGSRTPSARFKNAIYKLPTDANLKNASREDIDFKNAFEGKGLELFWVEDSLYDIYLMHVEGGGRVRLQYDDGTEEKVYLSYAGANGLRFQFLYKYMVERGLLPAGGASIAAQRRYLDNNPHMAQEVFASCPSYIYFKETDHEPLGVNNISLTEGRSIAVDSTIYRHIGMITYVKSTRPHADANGEPVFEPFSRFFVAQDTGGAIKGNARCDLYMGFGEEAALAANNMKVQGEQYFLIKK